MCNSHFAQLLFNVNIGVGGSQINGQRKNDEIEAK